ncbi:hypothetical protein XPN_0086 [Xanthomonas arboricola pv. pruni MAFF 301427]|nr:hypothetical protein XPN_0086 [Xanthomonas arboricola pv. pruni MAFF 301427]
MLTRIQDDTPDIRHLAQGFKPGQEQLRPHAAAVQARVDHAPAQARRCAIGADRVAGAASDSVAAL